LLLRKYNLVFIIEYLIYLIGFRKNVNNIFIEQLGYLPRKYFNNSIIDIGNTFACKFSRNKNNLHVIDCSSENDDIF